MVDIGIGQPFKAFEFMVIHLAFVPLAVECYFFMDCIPL